MTVTVDVEYCGTCGYAKKFSEMSQKIAEAHPDINVSGYEGRRASFEVRINGELVHSKLMTLAFPDFKDVSDIISEVSDGKEVRKVSKQQPIMDCVIS